jgi:serine O-acetyltransferase
VKSSLSINQLYNYVHRMLSHTIPDNFDPKRESISQFKQAMDRIEHCFSHIQRKYYYEQSEVVFDHLNGDHMATLLYLYANTAWHESGDTDLPTRLFYLNKIMHGLDLFYSVAMPDIFQLVHPVGTVIGHAKYQDYLVIYQNCTVGAVTGVYPSFGKGTILYSRASVLGDSKFGDNTVMAANSFLLDTDVPSDTIVVGQYPSHRFICNRKNVIKRCFDLAN